jgi:hypothetical protein
MELRASLEAPLLQGRNQPPEERTGRISQAQPPPSPSPAGDVSLAASA